MNDINHIENLENTTTDKIRKILHICDDNKRRLLQELTETDNTIHLLQDELKSRVNNE